MGSIHHFVKFLLSLAKDKKPLRALRRKISKDQNFFELLNGKVNQLSRKVTSTKIRKQGAYALLSMTLSDVCYNENRNQAATLFRKRPAA